MERFLRSWWVYALFAHCPVVSYACPFPGRVCFRPRLSLRSLRGHRFSFCFDEAISGARWLFAPFMRPCVLCASLTVASLFSGLQLFLPGVTFI